MSQMAGNKRNIGANTNLGFPTQLTIVLSFFVVSSASSTLDTFDLICLKSYQTLSINVLHHRVNIPDLTSQTIFPACLQKVNCKRKLVYGVNEGTGPRAI